MNRFLSSIGLRGRNSTSLKTNRSPAPTEDEKKQDSPTIQSTNETLPNPTSSTVSPETTAGQLTPVGKEIKERATPPVSVSPTEDVSEKSVMEEKSPEEASVKGFTLSATPSRLNHSNRNSRTNSRVNSPTVSRKHSRETSRGEMDPTEYNEESLSKIEPQDRLTSLELDPPKKESIVKEESKQIDQVEEIISEEELEEMEKKEEEKKPKGKSKLPVIQPAKKILSPLKPLNSKKSLTVENLIEKKNEIEEKTNSLIEEFIPTVIKQEKTSDLSPICGLCEDAPGVWKCEDCNEIYCEENECDQQIHKPMSKVKHKRTKIIRINKGENEVEERKKRGEQLKQLKQKQQKKNAEPEVEQVERLKQEENEKQSEREEKKKHKEKKEHEKRESDNRTGDQRSDNREEEELLDDDVIESEQPERQIYQKQTSTLSPRPNPIQTRNYSSSNSTLTVKNVATERVSKFGNEETKDSVSAHSAHNGMQQFEQHHLHPRQSTQLPYHQHAPADVPSRNVSFAYSLPTAVGITPLTAEEEAELTVKFHEYDVNHDGAIDKSEISRFLAELEFTYHDEYIESIMKFIFAQSHTATSQVLGLADFLYFMLIFYALHDSVVTLIDSLFARLFNRPADDALISVLCPFVKINLAGELDLNVMQEKLMAAVEMERLNQEKEGKINQMMNTQEFQRREAEWKEEERKREELDQKEREKQQVAEILRMEAERKRLSYAQAQEEKTQETIPTPKQMRLQQPSLSPSPSLLPSFSPSLTRSNTTPTIKSSLSVPSNTSSTKSVEFSSSLSYSPSSILSMSAPASSSNPPPVDPSIIANRLAQSLAAADEDYLKRTWIILISHFDSTNSGGLPIPSLVNCFHAMGLVLTTPHLTQFLTTSNVEVRGVLDFPAFCSLYSQLLYGWIEGEMDLVDIRNQFATFDRDGDGMISRAEFSYVINGREKIWSADELFDLVSLMDEGGDGLVSYVEYVHLLSQAHSNPSIRRSRTGKAGHEALLSTSSLTSLCSHLHRSSQPLPIHYCLTQKLMPNSFIPSLLARMSAHKQVQASQRVRPNFDSTGLRYEEFDCDNYTVVLPKALVAAYRKGNGETGASKLITTPSNNRASVMPPLNSSLTAPLSSTTPTPHPELHPLTATTTYLFALHKSTGLPSPSPVNQSLIFSRNVRIALLHPHTHALLSNVLTVRADVDPADEDEWKFEQQNNNAGAGAEVLTPVRWNEFVIRTSIENALLYIEHTCKVYQQQSSSEEAKQKTTISNTESIEFSCGYATFTLELHPNQPKPQRISRPITGGTLQCQQAIRESDVRRRGGWRNLLGSGNKFESQLSLTVTPANSLASNSSLRRSLSHLPLHFLTPTSHTKTLEPYYTLLSHVLPLSLTLPSQRNPARLTALDPAVSIYEKLVDDPALMEVFTQRWTKEYSLMNSKEKKMNKEGGLNPLIITRYRSILLSMQVPLVSLSAPLTNSEVGVKEIHRMVGAMTLLTKDPIKLLVKDKRYVWETSQNKGRLTGNEGKQDLDQSFYLPFNTSDIAYSRC